MRRRRIEDKCCKTTNLNSNKQKAYTMQKQDALKKDEMNVKCGVRAVPNEKVNRTGQAIAIQAEREKTAKFPNWCALQGGSFT